MAGLNRNSVELAQVQILVSRIAGQVVSSNWIIPSFVILPQWAASFSIQACVQQMTGGT
jgi:hypothetical protein